VAVQFGGTTGNGQDTTGYVADGQIQPVAVQRWLLYFLNFDLFFMSKTFVQI